MKLSSQEIAYLDVIRDTVNDFLQSKQMDPKRSSIAKAVERNLSRCTPGMTIHTEWVDTRDAYVAAIYPDIRELNDKSDKLMGILLDPKAKSADYLEAWCSIKNWYLNLDPRICTKGNPLCVDDGEQFVAIICHELGHVMTRDPMEFLVNFKEEKNRIDRMTMMALHKSPIVRKLVLPIFVATSSFVVVLQDPNRHGELEYMADSYVPEEYSGAMVSYMENHVLNTVDRTHLIKSESQYDNDQKTAIVFSHQALELMTKRRNVLRGRLRSASVAAPNAYMKEMVNFISKGIAGYDAATDVENPVEESRIVRYLNDQLATCEAMIPILEAHKVTERDLTLLSIDIDGIESTDDKLYCIQTIYDYIDDVTQETKKRLKGIKDEKYITSELSKDSRLIVLNKMRDQVINTKIKEPDQYGVFVKYPKGYEG